jgi:hypothetical protein
VAKCSLGTCHNNNGRGVVGEKRRAASTIFAWFGGGLKQKSMWQYIFLSYSLSKYFIKPFAYAVHHRNTVGINNNHFEYWSPVLVPLLIYNKKCNELNVGGGWVLRFLDEGGGVLKIKVLRLGAALNNVQYLVFITHRPPWGSHY